MTSSLKCFVDLIKGFGFTVYLAERGQYGFITDATEDRVLSFSFTDGGSPSGNYSPPSQKSGTGWRMDIGPESLTSFDAVNEALYAPAPDFTRRGGQGWKHYSTVADYLAMYGRSSRFTKA